MQADLKNIETSALVAMLETYQADYAKLMTAGSKEEFDLCKTAMEQLQNEINARQQSSADTTPETKGNTTLTDIDGAAHSDNDMTLAL